MDFAARYNCFFSVGVWLGVGICGGGLFFRREAETSPSLDAGRGRVSFVPVPPVIFLTQLDFRRRDALCVQ